MGEHYHDALDVHFYLQASRCQEVDVTVNLVVIGVLVTLAELVPDRWRDRSVPVKARLNQVKMVHRSFGVPVWFGDGVTVNSAPT
jgi:hypothetical protein